MRWLFKICRSLHSMTLICFSLYYLALKTMYECIDHTVSNIHTFVFLSILDVRSCDHRCLSLSNRTWKINTLFPFDPSSVSLPWALSHGSTDLTLWWSGSIMSKNTRKMSWKMKSTYGCRLIYKEHGANTIYRIRLKVTCVGLLLLYVRIFQWPTASASSSTWYISTSPSTWQ